VHGLTALVDWLGLRVGCYLMLFRIYQVNQLLPH